MSFTCVDVARAAGLEKGRRVGAERLFRCCQHDDTRPSLSINERKNRWICGPCEAGGGAWKLAAFLGGFDPDDKQAVLSWLRDHDLLDGERVSSKFVATHDYTDHAGELLFQVVRLRPKSFRQRRPDGNGGWVWNVDGVRRVLYRLPELGTATVVHINEGEKDADALHGIGLSATCNPGGAGKWRDEYTESFTAEHQVVVLPDNDDAGRRHAETVAASLHGQVASVKVLQLPDLAPKGDVTDFINACRDAEEAAERLATIANGADQWEPQAADEPTVEDRCTTIEIRPDLTGVTDEAIDAIAAQPSLGVYVRGRQLVRVARDGSPPECWLERWPGSPVIVPMASAQVLDVLDRAAAWVKFDGRRKEYVAAIPPSWVAQQVGARLEWPLPYLEAVTETPTIRSDGSILETPGWDQASRLLYEPIPGAATWPPVPEQPTGEDVRRGIAMLRDPLEDFPFKAESDGAAAIAVILTLLARHLIHGPVPLMAIRAPTPATGKTLLADVIGIMGTGRVPPVMTMTFESEELRKRVTSLAVEGAALILLDNVSGTLGSDTLAAALTATDWEDRILGTNTVVRVPLRVVWMVTGNNLGFRRTLGRRVIPIDLDAGVEQPEDRVGFRHADLRGHVRERRPHLVTAALTILRAFHLAGRPAHGGPRMGSFEAWDDLIRSAVIWASLADPASADPEHGRGRVRSQADDDTETLRLLLRALADAFPRGDFTAADVVTRSRSDEDLAAALDVAAAPRRGGKPTGRSLGYAFRNAVDRPVGGLVLRRWMQGRSGVVWLVESPEETR